MAIIIGLAVIVMVLVAGVVAVTVVTAAFFYAIIMTIAFCALGVVVGVVTLIGAIIHNDPAAMVMGLYLIILPAIPGTVIYLLFKGSLDSSFRNKG